MENSLEAVSKIIDNIAGHYNFGAEAQNIAFLTGRLLEDGFDDSDILVIVDEPRQSFIGFWKMTSRSRVELPRVIYSH